MQQGSTDEKILAFSSKTKTVFEFPYILKEIEQNEIFQTINQINLRIVSQAMENLKFSTHLVSCSASVLKIKIWKHRKNKVPIENSFFFLFIFVS